MTCKDCLCYGICNCDVYLCRDDGGEVIQMQDSQMVEQNCDNFKDKSRYIELPCKVGAEIFIIIDADNFPSYVDLGTVESFSVQQDSIWIFAQYECGLTYWHELDNLGKEFYLDPYEAEKALKEREK